MDRNACSKYFWQKMKSYWVKGTDQQISVTSLTLVTLVIFAAVCMGSWWSTTTRIWVNDATAVILCKNVFNLPKLYLPGNTFLKSNLLHSSIWRHVPVRSVQLQLMYGTVCQRQCSLLSHWTFFDAAWKLNCSSVLTTDTAPVKRFYCCVTHFHLPAAFCCGCNLEVYWL